MSLIHRLIFSLLLICILGTSPARAAELSVMAASSLTGALRDIARLYEHEHPGDIINLNFAGSQTLATQIDHGAPADLFISANKKAMARVINNGQAAAAKTLLHNRLVIAVRSDLTPCPTTVQQLARPGLLLAIGNPQVPVGYYTRKLFANLSTDATYGPEWLSKVKQNIVSEENMVKAIIAKLLLGEVDAGIVYQSDLAATDARFLRGIRLPENHNPLASYPVAKLKGAAADTDLFLAFLFSPAARQIFSHHGFIPGDNQ